MIYIDVMGNLGNQLFQYACARKIQEETGQKICLNTYFSSKYRPEYKCSLGDYVLNANVVFEESIPLPWYVNTYTGLVRILKGVVPNLLFNIIKRFGIFIWMKNTYIELPIIRKKKNYYLVGYWQSTKYFEDIDLEIRKELIPKEKLLQKNQEIYNKILCTESVCVTIRRGDYVTNEVFKNKFFICDTDYFLKGIKKIREKIPNAIIFVFSDDIEWVKNNVPIAGEVYYESGNDPVWEKLRLMSACKHFVISNSTFSWWAQYFALNKNKIVIAPDRWFTSCEKSELFMENWILIPTL